MKTKLFYPLVISVLVMTSMGFYQLQSKPAAFICNANMIANSDTTTVDVNIIYSVSEHTATAYLQGSVRHDDTQFRLRRVVYMSSKLEDSTLTLMSKRMVTGPGDNADARLLKKVLPHLYISEGIKRDFVIHRINDLGYIFTSGNGPSFYCKSI